ncbi:hypothetical protein BC940DRAFT_346392 [Gongronella butleri]|nr:hypothetical protein BC940DRAFT_346392 [Gongronella butleri]
MTQPRPTPLRALTVMSGQQDLNDLHIPTITDDAQDVIGLQGRIRLQKTRKNNTSQWMDIQRNTLQAYEYLCHIGEAKEWIESCLLETIDPITQLEDSMKNGIVLAKLANWIAPGVVHRIINDTKHKFLHSENINSFFKALQAVRLPQIFWFELTDLYDKKNIPKVIFCIHALSHLLARKKLAPRIKNLFGELEFTKEELSSTQKALDGYGVVMPNFTSIDKSLQRELDEEDDNFDIDTNFQFKKIQLKGIDALPGDSTTPDLIVEDSDSDDEVSPKYNAPLFSSQRAIVEPKKEDWTTPANLDRLIRCQAMMRGRLQRREFQQVQQVHRSTLFQNQVNQLQARVRGVLCRQNLGQKKISLAACDETWVTKIQAACCGHLGRRSLNALLEMVDRNVHMEGFTTQRLVHHVNQELITQKNPSIGTVKNFIHLLSDNDLDYNAEVALESVRQKVINTIRENKQLDAYLTMLDTKIALLMRNAISIDEVLKVTNGPLRKQLRRFSDLAAMAFSDASSTVSAMDPFASTTINQKNQTVLDLYQQLVYTLQTEPRYLATLVSLTKDQDLGGDGGELRKRMESTILALFGYATHPREEFLLINLCRYCIDEEIKLISNPQEFMRGNYTFMKLVVQTNRGAKEREFFRHVFGALITEVVGNEFLNLETNPVEIYHQVINDEEKRTGMPSQRNYNVTSQEALADEEVRQRYISNLMALRTMTEKFLSAITQALDHLPYGIRAVARELRLVLESRFPREPTENISKILSYFICYRYLTPAIVDPEEYDIIEMPIGFRERKNLGEVVKVLQKISTGTVFDASDMFLAPLNEYVEKAGKEFAAWFIKVTDVDDPETFFGMEVLDDHTRTQKPAIYISPYELCHLHYMLEQYLEDLAPKKQGTLVDILSDLGPSQFQPGVELSKTTRRLQVTNRHDDLPQDPSSQVQQLVTDTKRLVVYVMQVQAGRDLLEIFNQSVSDEHEAQWKEAKRAEFQELRDPRLKAIAQKHRMLKLGNTTLDVNNLSFFQLKTITYRLVTHLAKFDEQITPDDRYQGVLNMIVEDITGKNTRRQQREKEITKLEGTLGNLQAKHAYLSEQRKTYEHYLRQSMDTMAKKRGRKQRFVWPFSRQYLHMRHLEKQGKVPTFGSFKYSAKQLFDRGVILSLEGVQRRHYDRITITLSMDQSGIINFQGSYDNWSTTALYMDVQYEQLLQTQFEGIQTMTLLDGMMKVNVNLLIFMINKKFYSA